MILFNTKNITISDNVEYILIDIPSNSPKLNTNYKLVLKNTLSKKSLELSVVDIMPTSKLIYRFNFVSIGNGEYEYTLYDSLFKTVANGLMRIYSDEEQKVVNYQKTFDVFDAEKNSDDGYITPILL